MEEVFLPLVLLGHCLSAAMHRQNMRHFLHKIVDNFFFEKFWMFLSLISVFLSDPRPEGRLSWSPARQIGSWELEDLMPPPPKPDFRPKLSLQMFNLCWFQITLDVLQIDTSTSSLMTTTIMNSKVIIVTWSGKDKQREGWSCRKPVSRSRPSRTTWSL